jgi:hypothetical protein
MSLAFWFAAWLVFPSVASARKVYLTGVQLDASVVLTQQTFPACEVKFDENGDVWIVVKGVKIALQTQGMVSEKMVAETAAVPVSLTKRYWLVSPQVKRGLVQYDIDVFMNGTWIKKVRSGDDKVVMDITKNVRPGENRLRLVATKNMGDRRVSSSPADTMEIVLGEGTVGGGTVMVDKPIVVYRRTAHETQNFAEDFHFVGR